MHNTDTEAAEAAIETQLKELNKLTFQNSPQARSGEFTIKPVASPMSVLYGKGIRGNDV